MLQVLGGACGEVQCEACTGESGVGLGGCVYCIDALLVWPREGLGGTCGELQREACTGVSTLLLHGCSLL